MLVKLTKYNIDKDRETGDRTITGESPVMINPALIVAIFPHREGGASIALQGFNSNIVTKETPDEIFDAIEKADEDRATFLAYAVMDDPGVRGLLVKLLNPPVIVAPRAATAGDGLSRTGGKGSQD